jgi:hypothetical protein
MDFTTAPVRGATVVGITPAAAWPTATDVAA